MIRSLALGCLAAASLPGAGQAQELRLPDLARPLAERISPLDSYALPVAAFDGQSVPERRFEGRVERQTWRIDATPMTTLQLLQPLREQIAAQGFEPLFECRDSECGGFDFRFSTEVVPAPDMQVDIRNYRFVAAVREPDEAISLLVSRSRTAAYIQIIRVVPVRRDVAPEPETRPLGTDDLFSMLMDQGHVVLPDLDFATGADTLGTGSYASLEQIAARLQDSPTQRVAVVGHTDSTGSLAENIALSKRRAEAVRRRLIDAHGLSPSRIEAEGMGYLAPVASNLTPEGRDANRRVEVILLSGG